MKENLFSYPNARPTHPMPNCLLLELSNILSKVLETILEPPTVGRFSLCLNTTSSWSLFQYFELGRPYRSGLTQVSWSLSLNAGSICRCWLSVVSPPPSSGDTVGVTGLSKNVCSSGGGAVADGVSGGKLLDHWDCWDLGRGRCLVRVCKKKYYWSLSYKSLYSSNRDDVFDFSANRGRVIAHLKGYSIFYWVI